MTTLGLSTLLHAQTTIKNFHGMYTIGLVIYFIGFVEYFLTLAMKTNKALLKKTTLIRSMRNPDEAMFFAAFWIATYGILAGAVVFSHPDPGTNLARTFMALFWIYCFFAICAGVGIIVILSHYHSLESKNMTPAW
jgi:tellurite resistance protein TehA-like permease